MKIDYTKIIKWFETTDFYKDFLSRLPSPLNNPVFAGIFVLALLIIFICSVVDHINNYRIRRRIRRKSREYEERKLDERLQQEKAAEQNKVMEKYLQFMMMVQMQNAMSLQGMSFDQWKEDVYENEKLQSYFKDDKMPNIDTIEEFLKKAETSNIPTSYGPFTVSGFDRKEN